jgi:hypothetical protein
MCNCTTPTYSTNSFSSRKMSIDASLCKPVQYYLDILDFVKVNEDLQLPTHLTSLAQSQINVYRRNCMAFQPMIEDILTQYNITV